MRSSKKKKIFTMGSESIDYDDQIEIKISPPSKKPNLYTRNKQKLLSLKKERISIDLAEIKVIGTHRLTEVTDKLADMESAIEENNRIRSMSDPSLKIKNPRICCTSLTKDLDKVKPVGWMAIFGDGLGNFIDGLSIGASVNQNLLLGLTTAIASYMGNIPQELGKYK